MLGFGVLALLGAWRISGAVPAGTRAGRACELRQACSDTCSRRVLVLASLAVLVTVVQRRGTPAPAVWGS